MANVIVYASANNALISPGRVETKGEGANFDTVTERWYFGNGITILAGTFATGTNMYCLGASDVEQLPGNAVLATITYRGLLGPEPVSRVMTKGIRETNYAAISGIPGTSGDVQGRIIDEVDGESVRRIYVGPTPTESAKPTRVPGKDATVINTAKIHSYPFGWICTNFSAEELLPGIWAVSEEWTYYHKVIFGS